MHHHSASAARVRVSIPLPSSARSAVLTLLRCRRARRASSLGADPGCRSTSRITVRSVSVSATTSDPAGVRARTSRLTLRINWASSE